MPGVGKVRNNLVYTSLVSDDHKTFVKWFHNDSAYHMGKNQIVDQDLMESKWQRELKYIQLMDENYPDSIPKILDIDHKQRKIYLGIDGPDFWQQSLDNKCSFDYLLKDWQDQMLSIINSHKKLGLWKYSMHPSSYFIIDNKLKSINYFFSYHDSEPPITIEEHRSHISLERQKKLENILEKINLRWDSKVSFKDLQIICFDSFRSNYPDSFINRAKLLYVD